MGGSSWREVTGGLEILKLLIADSLEDFRLSLAEQVRGTYRIRTCGEGNETLEMILSFKPDLLVLDMMLPGLDGIAILERAAQAGVCPLVLATAKFSSDYLVQSAQRLRVAYMMVKPCEVKATADRLKDLAAHVDGTAVTRPDPRTEISNVLLNLGFSTKLKGYAFLREAILEEIHCPGQSVTKILYPAVGKVCNASSTQVERSIRSAILKAWEKRDEALWRMYFPVNGAGVLERPTNAAFISCVADRIVTMQNT